MIPALSVLLAVTIPVAPGESIQNAIDSSSPGDTILIEQGVHTGSGENLAVITGDHNGIVITGNPLQPEGSVLSGDGLSGSIIMLDGLSAGPVDSTTVITGLTFSGADPSEEPFGGGLRLYHGSPLISFCLFQNNTADNGSCIYSWKGAPQIRGCTFNNNFCMSAGAGVYLYSSDAVISDCVFINNRSQDDGGAMYLYHCSPEITNCVFTEGFVNDDGAGIYCYALSNPDISFCTFQGNNATNTGSAVYFRVNSSPHVNHCIATGNLGPAFYIQDGGDPVFQYNCVWGNPDGDYGNLPDPTGTQGNISLDPLLTAGWYLEQVAAGQSTDSPCVDAGEGSAFQHGLDSAWTRTDSVPDAGTVDLGYHHTPVPQQQSGPEQESFHGVRMACNPAYGTVKVLWSDEHRWNTVRVFDVRGRKLLEADLAMWPESAFEFNTGALPGNGCYFLLLTADTGSVSLPFAVLSP